MFERFRKKKEPEKKNPIDQFKGHENEHGQYGILFGSNKDIVNKYKSATNFSCAVVYDKEESRIHNMLDAAGKAGNEVISLQTSALTVVAIASSREEALAMQIGVIKFEAQGITICPECLRQAIFQCEEQLNALKDIQGSN